eukprot:2113-Alexandrium_andersonii.AAC.1
MGARARQQGRRPIRRRGLSVEWPRARRDERERRRERSSATPQPGGRQFAAPAADRRLGGAELSSSHVLV